MAEPNRKIPELTQQDIERFWSKVEKSGPIPPHRPELGPCWVWTAGTFNDGYGLFSAAGGKSLLKAHRVSYFLHTGRDPVGFLTCHHCDHHPCVNPAHLFLGTPLANMQDRDLKGRTSAGAGHSLAIRSGKVAEIPWQHRRPELILKGEHHGNAKLTESSVREIRSLYESKVLTQKQIADQFGITQINVSLIVRRKSWRHVD